MFRCSLRQYAQAYLQTSDDARTAVAAFDACASAVASIPLLRAFLANTAVPSATRRDALAEAVPGQPDQVYNLFLLLAKDRRLRDMHALESVMREEAAALTSKKHAIITSAVPLPAPVLRRISDALATMFTQDVWLEPRVDPSIIAGLRVQVGDWMFDATRIGRLQRLAHALQQRSS